MKQFFADAATCVAIAGGVILGLSFLDNGAVGYWMANIGLGGVIVGGAVLKLQSPNHRPPRRKQILLLSRP